MRIPKSENYSTHCSISHRPPFRTCEPLFYRCPHCGAVTVIHYPSPADVTSHASGEHRKPFEKNIDEHYPERTHYPVLSCCDTALAPLQLSTDPGLLEDHKIEFTIFGGFEHNSMNVTVGSGIHPMQKDHRIEWLYVRGFQGGQLKMLPPAGSAKANFSFADEDAYAYCDRPICKMGREHCLFQCKREVVLYAYCSRHGLFRLAL